MMTPDAPPPAATARPLASEPVPLLIRHAEALYWLARYVERAESLARILEIHSVLAREIEGRHNWVSILQLYSWIEQFRALGLPMEAQDLLHFAILDRRNPSAILSCIAAARENARILRPRLSVEVWNQINRLFTDLGQMQPQDLSPLNLPRVLTRIREAVQTHTGIIEGTLPRDEAWSFYQLGRMVERGDQTTRALDAKAYLLTEPLMLQIMEPDGRMMQVMRAGAGDLDHDQWSILLRALGAYHAFQRRHAGRKDARSISQFLLFDATQPRSLATIIARIDEILTELRRRTGIAFPSEVHARMAALTRLTRQGDVDAVLRSGLHGLLDGVQRDLIALNDALGAACFTY